MKVISHRLFDQRFGNLWHEKVHYGWDYEDFKAHKGWQNEWSSFDSILWDPETKLLHLGITSFDETEITRSFDPETGEFARTGFEKVAAPYDAKFHRSFVKRGKDGCYYTAIALLHNIDRFFDAPGGAICKYDPKAKKWEKLCIPMEHVYIQNIILDEKNDWLYCITFAPEYVLRYDLNTGEIKNYGLISSGIAGMAQPESCVLDDDGTLWGCWKITRAWSHDTGTNETRLFKIRAGADRIEFLQKGLPKADGSFGFDKPESFYNLGNGYVYATGANGSIFRIDPSTDEITLVCRPIVDQPSRLAHMALGPDGYAYGVTGRFGDCRVIRFNPKDETYELSDTIVDQEGESCWQIHNVAVIDDGRIYAGENDVPHRSGYLWEIQL